MIDYTDLVIYKILYHPSFWHIKIYLIHLLD